MTDAVDEFRKTQEAIRARAEAADYLFDAGYGFITRGKAEDASRADDLPFLTGEFAWEEDGTPGCAAAVKSDQSMMEFLTHAKEDVLWLLRRVGQLESELAKRPKSPPPTRVISRPAGQYAGEGPECTNTYAPVTCGFDTPDAILALVFGKKRWVPKWAIHEDSDVYKKDTSGKLILHERFKGQDEW